jgi:hypothetical protein
MKHFVLEASLALVLLACVGLLTSPALADNGQASLFVAGASHTPTHWNIPILTPITAELRGVSTMEVGDPLPATLTVWVKSTYFGNTMLTATRIDDTSDYTFDYTAPEEACFTSIVSYYDIGLNANNDLADDGIRNGSGISASGFRYVDDMGLLIDCEPVGTEARSWGTIKGMYR